MRVPSFFLRRLPLAWLSRWCRAVALPAAGLIAAVAAGAEKISGVNFGPFYDGRDPSRGAVVSETELRDQLQLVAPRTEWVRTYSLSNGLEPTGRLAHTLGLKAAVGIWLGPSGSANDLEISRGIAVAKAGHADMIIVGSESLLRRDLSIDQLLAYLRTVKAAVPANVLVTTADSADFWLQYPALVSAVDVLLINVYPYWRGVHIDHALATLHRAYRQVQAIAGAKGVWISETGWPSAGRSLGRAEASDANAALYFKNFVSWAKATGARYFYFSYIDEPWKRAAEGESGAHWGLWDGRFQLKPGMQATFDGAVVPDNWSTPPAFSGIYYVPPYGNTTDPLVGFLWNAPGDAYRISTYIDPYGWWVKPTFADPLSGLGVDGVWNCDFTTGGVDHNAIRIFSYLVPANYAPPLLGGASALPAELARFPRFEVIRKSPASPVTPPLLTGPASQIVAPGGTATFSVSASGTGPFTYQWRKDGVDLAGATEASLRLANVAAKDAGGYAVAVSSGFGTVTNPAALLLVNSVTTVGIATQPVGQRVDENTGAFLEVIAVGAGLRYQWRRNGLPVAGATNSALYYSRATPALAGNYDVVVTGSGASVTSSVALLAVNPIPGNNAFATRFALTGATISATGTNVAADFEAGEPNPFGISARHSVWWTWTAPLNGTVTIDTLGSSVATVLVAYTGTELAQLKYVTSDNNSVGGRTSKISFLALAGSTYQLLVDGASGATGGVALNLRQTAQTTPLILTQPVDRTTTTTGTTLTLSVTAIGTAPLQYEWRRDGAVVTSGTNSTLNISSLKVADSGSYTVRITNSAGSVTSSATSVVVNMVPVVESAPRSQTITVGGSVTFQATVTASPAPAFQWQRQPRGSTTWTDISISDSAYSGVRSATLVVLAPTTSMTGDRFRYVASNTAGGITSDAAVLTVLPTSRLRNLSFRGNFPAGGRIAMGFVVSGDPRSVLVRAVGPGLSPFLSAGSLAGNPRLEIFRQDTTPTLIASNDDWAVSPVPSVDALTAASLGAGAFPLSPGSLDAAALLSLSGTNSAQAIVRTGGIGLLELYDCGSDYASRLINLSVLHQAGSGADTLIAGFTVDGKGKKSLLIRAVGPSLGQFNVQGVMSNPRLLIYSGSVKIAENDDWGGDTTLRIAASSVAAFSLPFTRDAALILVADPGIYTAIVTSADGVAGVALIEIYELP